MDFRHLVSLCCEGVSCLVCAERVATCGVEERTSLRAVFSNLATSSMNLGSLIVCFFLRVPRSLTRGSDVIATKVPSVMPPGQPSAKGYC